MQRRQWLVWGAAALGGVGGVVGLSGCSRSDDGPAQNPGQAAGQAAEAGALSPEAGLAAAIAQGRGFEVGAAGASHTAYVFFDPQCPHCSQLWLSARPLLDRLRMVWLPVAFIGPQSKPQGALLLAAADPQAAMDAHEASLLAGQGGLAVPERGDPSLQAAIDANTDLLGRLGADSVPFVLTRQPGGEVLTHAGAMDTAALVQWLGLQP